MRRSLLVGGILWSTLLPAQHPVVQDVLDAIRIDSLMHYVAQLTGELPVDVGNGPQLISSRNLAHPDHAVARAWLVQKLTEIGYGPVLQPFNVNGMNVLAWKPGLVHPDEPVIVCAHYDTMPAGAAGGPGADDDGSGTAAVLEAARVLRDVDLEHTVLFALWDEEEVGLQGSAYYAQGEAANDALIRGVINMDAIAYDGNGDKKARIHTRPIANSIELADSVFAVRAHYDIDLDLILTNPGASYSDHASFWNNDYGAILVIEEFGADGNPFYHTPNDLMAHFDVPYFEKLARLSIATAATIAVPVAEQSVFTPSPDFSPQLSTWPNPAMHDAEAWLGVRVAGYHRVELVDALGRVVRSLYAGELLPGRYRIPLPMAACAPGLYLVRVVTGGQRPVTTRIMRATE